MKSDNLTYCEVCGNNDSNCFSEVFVKKKYTVVSCNNCKFTFIPKAYRKDIPYSNYRDEDVLSEVRKGNNYLKYRRHKLRVDFIKKYAKTGTLFDIGTGWGHFLYAAKRNSFSASGVEMSELMHHYAVNDLCLNVTNANFFELEIPENSYDVVTMWDVLEHLNEPNKAIKKAYKILKPGGYIFLQVPQIDSFVAKRQKENWTMLSIEHISYFSKETITKFLNSNNFEIIKIKSSFEFKLFLMFTILPILKRFKKTKNSKKAKISNSERQSFFNKFTKMPKFLLVIMLFFHDILYKLMSGFNIGEEMIVVAKKPNNN